ncbi:MAG: copper amine oxidase N-terminal domain-containing protein [Clostridia bacterium]|nr:copper amine oxidase N-terminal domain-containing protein [Clostridia bacterium]
MKKSKVVSLIMAVTTVFSTAMPVFATDVATSAYDYSTMPISEVYKERRPILISPRPTTEREITVLLNDEKIDFQDDKGKVTPQLINGRTMVPLRKIFELYDATVDWNNETSTAYATKEDMAIELQINNNIAKVTKEDVTEEVPLDSVPVVIDGRTLVPVRFVSETLGLKVGWDEDTQTVIIIDPSFVLDVVKEEAPIFYELISADYETPKTSETKLSVNGNLKYTNTEDKSVNSNLKLVLTGTTKVNEDAVGVDIDSKLTGKGIVFDEMKSEGFEKITLSAIFDMKNFVYYLKSSLLEEQIGKKWLKEALANEEEIKEMINMDSLETAEKVELEDIVNKLFDYVNINLNTYENTKLLTRLFCLFVNDDYFTVSGRTTKTYTYEITAKDINEICEAIGAGTLLPEQIVKEAKLKYTMKFKDNMSTEASLNLNGDIEYGTEKLVIDMTTKATLTSANKTVTIKMPAEKDVEEFQSTSNTTIENAKFASFAVGVSDVQMGFDVASVSKYGNERALGKNVSYEQVYNYVAKGGEYANEKYLPVNEAKALKCTKINEQYAEDVLEMPLPVVSVKNENGKNVNASYYVTNEGKVFVWPPFEAKDGYYVSSRDILESKNESEIFKNGYKFMVGNVEIEVGKDIK